MIRQRMLVQSHLLIRDPLAWVAGEMTFRTIYGIGHVPFHFLIPLAIYRYTRNQTQLIQLEAANLIDLDHLLAARIFVAERCSLTTHPLHGLEATAVYVILSLFAKTRWLGLGALLHLLIDSPTCF